MNYAETQQWDKRGTFSGSSVGIGTGERQTKRADPVLGVVVFVFFAVIALAAYSATRTLPGDMVATSTGGNDPMSRMYDGLMRIFPMLVALAVIFIYGMELVTDLLNQKQEDRLNKEVWPKQVNRYNQLRYCENCHILFDPQRRSADGSVQGFAQLMSYLD